MAIRVGDIAKVKHGPFLMGSHIMSIVSTSWFKKSRLTFISARAKIPIYFSIKTYFFYFT